MQALYFHGGPGFNSHPEKSLLQARFEADGWDVQFWNEPSAQRPEERAFRSENAFDRLLESAEAFLLVHYFGDPIVLIGHSFGAHAVCFLALRHPEKIAKAVFVSPDLALEESDRRLFEIARRDYLAHGDERHAKLAALIARRASAFDAATEEGFDLVVQNPRLFGFYWSERERMAAFLPHYAEPGYGIDLDGFRAVRRSFREIALADSRVPALAIFGEADACVSENTEIASLGKRFKDLKIHRMAHSAHYPHVEDPDTFLEILNRESPRLARIPRDASSRRPAPTPLS